MFNGRKKGQKRRDFHYDDVNGTWDSKFEAQVFQGGLDAGIGLVRNSEAIPYLRVVPRASCADCGSNRVGETRRITWDLHSDTWHPLGKENGCYVECKGYLRGPKRSLYRSFFKDKPDTPVVFIIQSNFKVGKGTFGGWITKYLNCPWALWKGKWSELQWVYPEPEKPKSTRKKQKQ